MSRVIFTLLFATLAGVLPARAEWLYWTMDFSASDSAGASPWTDSTTAPQVWLVASTDPKSGANGTVLADMNGQSSLTMEKGGTALELGTATDLGEYSAAGYTFFIEMGAIAGQADYTSTGISYDNLVSSGFVQSGWSSTEGFWNASSLAFSPTHNVPEPTSGLLVMVGLALMALKRRNEG